MTTTIELIEKFLNKKILLSTTDGRVLTGTLTGFDQACNLILSKCTERVFSEIDGVEFIDLGLFLIRGENVGVFGEIDQIVESELDFTKIKSEPIKTIR